jgi:hypothetical protein
LISISAGSTTPASSPRLGGLRRPLGHALVLAERPVDDGLEHVAEVRVARAVPVYEAGPRDVLEIVGHDASNQNFGYRSDSRRSEVKVTNSSGEQCPQRAADLLGHGRLRLLLVPLQPLQRRAAQKQRPLDGRPPAFPSSPAYLITIVRGRLKLKTRQRDLANRRVSPYVGDAVLAMARLPLDTNVQFMTIMATKMPFVGGG